VVTKPSVSAPATSQLSNSIPAIWPTPQNLHLQTTFLWGSDIGVLDALLMSSSLFRVGQVLRGTLGKYTNTKEIQDTVWFAKLVHEVERNRFDEMF
jgi:hypothetical protein